MKSIRIEVKWAIIFIVMMLLWMLLERLGGFHDKNIELHPIVTNFVMIPAVLVYVLALRDKRKNFYGGFITYKQAFISGLIISVIVGVFTPITQWITSTIITPDYFKNAIEYAVENNKMSREAAEAYFNLKNYIIQSTIFAPIMGAVTTAIVAIFIKKPRPTDS